MRYLATPRDPIAGPVAPTVAPLCLPLKACLLLSNHNLQQMWRRMLLKLELHLPHSNSKVQRLKRCTYLDRLSFFLGRQLGCS
jgi:hypothetical protein